MGKKILVIDDDPEIITLLTVRLGANDFDVISANDALYAVRMAFEEKPDLIILDINMPGGGGVSVFDRVRKLKTTTKVPVVFLSGCEDRDVQKQVLEMGAVGFISKPFKSEELLTVIRKALGDTQ
jgi:DNA-binding response OmpR family regulator